MHARLSLLAAAAIAAASANAQSSITPIATFGINGWLAPGSSAYLNTGNTERGMAYNPATGNIVLVSRAGGNNVRVIDGVTGADLGGLDVTGIQGGTFQVNMAGCSDDGSIYVCNLSTSNTSAFKVYKWTDEGSGATTPPAVAYNALSGVGRTGDSFAVRGTGLSARFAAAGSAASSLGQNSCFVEGPLDSSNGSVAYTSIPNTNASSNDYRLGLTFVDSTTVIGNQGTAAVYTTFNGTSATVTNLIPLGGAAQRPLDYTVINGVPLLAVIDSNSSNVSIFEIADPSNPNLLLVGNNTSGTLPANVNAVGNVQWGAVSGNSATLYAMNCNQGIQAFTVTIDQATAITYGSGCGTSVVDTVYEMFGATNPNDLSGSALQFLNTGSSYILSGGAATLRGSATATSLALGDDADATYSFQTGATLMPLPDGSTATGLTVCSNGFVSAAAGNQTGWTPSAFEILNEPQTAWYSWTDLRPVGGGGAGDVYIEETATHCYVIYDAVQTWGAVTTNTFEFHFEKATGNVDFVFGSVDPSTSWGVGYSVGGPSVVDPGNTNLSDPLSFPVVIFGDQGGPLALGVDAAPWLGSTINVTISRMKPTTLLAANIYGFYAQNIDLTSIGMAGCFQLASQDSVQLLFPGGAESFSSPFTILNDPSLTGLRVRVQGAAYDPAGSNNTLGAVSSNGMELTIR